MVGARDRRSRAPRRRSGDVLPMVRPIAEELADLHDAVLWEVEFLREAGRETLRVLLDTPGGIDAEALKEYSEELSRRLDETDAVPGEARYWLEVSSPGAERKLKTPEQFRLCRGRTVRLTFRDGRTPLVGEIVDADGDTVEVEVSEEGPVRVPLGEISQARLRVSGV